MCLSWKMWLGDHSIFVFSGHMVHTESFEFYKTHIFAGSPH